MKHWRRGITELGQEHRVKDFDFPDAIRQVQKVVWD